MSIPIYSLPQARPRTVTFAENVPTNPARRLIRPRAERLSLSIALAPLVSQRSLLFRVQTELGEKDAYDQLSSIESSRTKSNTPGSTPWTISAQEHSEGIDRLDMGAITTALSLVSAYSQDSFYGGDNIVALPPTSDSNDIEADERLEEDDALTPTSAFPNPQEAQPPSPTETDEDEKIFPRQWLSFSAARATQATQEPVAPQISQAVPIPPRRTSVHARLLQARRPALDAPPLPLVPSIPPVSTSALDVTTTIDVHLPTRRRGLHSKSSNDRSRDNDARRYGMAFSPTSALEWELVEGMGMVSPDSAVLPEDEQGQYLSFTLPSPTIPEINHKLTMGLPQPRPISQLIISPPSSSTARYSRQKPKGKAARSKAHRLSGVPAGHHRASAGGLSSRPLKTPQTPRTPSSPTKVKKQITSPRKTPIRVRGPRLPRPPKSGKKLPVSPAPRSESSSSKPNHLAKNPDSDSWDEAEEPNDEHGFTEAHIAALPTIQLPEFHHEKQNRVQFRTSELIKATKSQVQPDTQRRATMMNTLFSRLSIDPKSLKRNRKTMAAAAQTDSEKVEAALPALSFSPITLDIPGVPSLTTDEDVVKKQDVDLPSAQVEDQNELTGLQHVRSLRSSHPPALPSTLPSSKPSLSRSTPSLPPQLPFPSLSQTTLVEFRSQPENKPSHPPSSFAIKPKAHQRTLSSPALGGFTVSVPITSAKLAVSAEAEDIKPTPSVTSKSAQKPLRKPHRRTISHSGKALFSPPPPLPTEAPGVPPLPTIPALPPIPNFALDERRKLVAFSSGR